MNVDNKMENYAVFQSLKSFIQQIKELSPNEPVVVSYLSLLNKITEAKTFAVNKQCESLTTFLKENASVLTTVPLALNTYELQWLPLKSSSAKFSVNLMPAFAASTVDQATVLHCHILKMASLVFVDDPQYKTLLDQLEKTICVEKVDFEKEIVDTMFGLVKEIDVNAFDKNEPEKFVEAVMTTKMGAILPMLRRPGMRWKVLFAYMFEVVEKMGKEKGISDPDVDELLQSLKAADYEVASITPKIFEIVKKLRINLTPTFTQALIDGHQSSDQQSSTD
jgi:hypothetical protein